MKLLFLFRQALTLVAIGVVVMAVLVAHLIQYLPIIIIFAILLWVLGVIIGRKSLL